MGHPKLETLENVIDVKLKLKFLITLVKWRQKPDNLGLQAQPLYEYTWTIIIFRNFSKNLLNRLVDRFTSCMFLSHIMSVYGYIIRSRIIINSSLDRNVSCFAGSGICS